MEAALASTGPYMASLRRDVLPQLQANASRLEVLFDAIDSFESTALLEAEAAVERLEAVAVQLEKDRAALEPSSITRVFSSFFGPAERPERKPWSHPEVFDSEALMAAVRTGGGNEPPSNRSPVGAGSAIGEHKVAEEICAPQRRPSKGYEIVAPEGLSLAGEAGSEDEPTSVRGAEIEHDGVSCMPLQNGGGGGDDAPPEDDDGGEEMVI